MKIISMEVDGLHGSSNILKINFNDDLNIITGKNGAGKTTVLKLLWYIISGNINLALNEIIFRKVNIKTDEYECDINYDAENTKVTWTNIENEKTFYENVYDERYRYEIDDFVKELVHSAEHVPNNLLQDTGSSLFFPTFRRIEGGFSTETKNLLFLHNKRPSVTDSLEEVLAKLSRQLSNRKHQFIASVSTKDIDTLLIRKFSELSEEVNHLQQQISNESISKIKNVRNKTVHESTAQDILFEVQRNFEELEEFRNEKMKPFETLKDLVLNFLKHSGVKLGSRDNKTFNIGDAADAINSDLLSAGEKQMLSFIAYNTFYQNTIFIIDEPELSLHVDWQRQLLPTLMQQGTSNQFIIATHSPFIYSKYPDKEAPLIEDRGFGNTEIKDILGRE